MDPYSAAPTDGLSGMSDEQLAELFNQTPATDFQSLSDDELRELFGASEVEQEPVPPTIAAPPPEMSTGEALAGGARELAGGAMFEFSDEAEAAARAPFSDRSYEGILKDIRQNRARFGEAYPATALGLNVAGGVGSMFVPGANVVGRAAQGLTGISKLASPAARVAASGALAGTAAGAGSGEDLRGRLENAGTGAVLGAGLGAGAYGAGKAGRWLGDVFSARGAEMRPDEAAQYAAEMVNRKIAEGGQDVAGLRDLAQMSEQYGVPFNIGTASPQLARLSELAVNAPSEGREGLVRRLLEQQSGAGERVQQRVQRAIPTPDYFASEERIIDTLRSNAKQAYGAVNDVEIRDPRIMDILHSPDIRSAYADALANVRREMDAAKLRGEDPSQYDLRKVFEPILDAEGSLVGLGDKATTIPDIKTLNQIKIALDRRIGGLYASGRGGDATALKNLRNAFVDRLDQVGPPEYRAARQQYKGDIEIKEALENGRDANKLRWQQVGKLVRDYSPGELQAFKTGYVQRLMQGFEDTSRRRNFAREIVDNTSQRKKLQALMSPDEYKVFEAAMRREADMFESVGRITGGSQTAGRLADRADFEQQMAGGNVDAAVSMMLNPSPGNLAQKALSIANSMRNANVSRAAYTQLARILKAGTPAEVDDALRALEAAAPAQRASDLALERGAAKVAAGATATAAPTPEIERERLPEVEDVIVPSIDDDVMDTGGLGTMPLGAGGPEAGAGAGLSEALSSLMPDWQAVLGDGSVSGPSGSLGPDQVAKALGVPVESWLAYAGGQ